MGDLTEARKRVKRGAAWLDKKLGPEWRKRIKPRHLWMASGCRCIIGQLEGDYLEGARRLGMKPTANPAIQRGFIVAPGYAEPVEYEDLDKAWREELKRA